MNSTVAVAILGFLGTIIGSGLGVMASAKLTNFRLQKLEEKVDKHNNVIERVYKLEGRVDALEDKKGAA